MRIITILPGAFASGILLALLACSSASAALSIDAPQLVAPQQVAEPAPVAVAPAESREAEQPVTSGSQEVICTNDSLFELSLRRNSYGGAEVGVIAPHGSERISYQLDGASELVFYPLYRVPLTDKVVLSTEIDRSRFFLRKSWDIVEEVVIPAPEHFENDTVYFIFTNKSDTAISLMRRDSFLPLVSDTPATILNAGETGVYKGTASGLMGLSLYHSEIPVPQHAWQDGYVYTLLFDGERIEPIDGRPLHQVGQPILATVEFQGDELTTTEQQLFVQAIQKQVMETNTPVRVIPAADVVSQQQVCHYAFVVTLTTEETTLPIGNRKVIRGEVTVAFVRNGIVLHQSEKGAITETNTGLVMSRATNFIRDNSAFYQGLARVLSE
jgi:hypothetical protein